MTLADQTQDVVSLPNGKVVDKKTLNDVLVVLEAMDPLFSSKFGEIVLCAKSSIPLTPILQSWFDKYQLCHSSGVLKESAKTVVLSLLKREGSTYVIRQFRPTVETQS